MTIASVERGTPTPDTVEGVLDRVRALVPELRANARESEQLKQMAPASLEALTAAGVFKLTMPKDQGGYEAPPKIVAEVLAEIGRGDPSAAWIVAIITAMNLWPALMTDQASEEIYATPDLRITGLIAPTGTAVEVEGGMVFNGTWKWNTGQPHAQWVGLSALLHTDQGPRPVSGFARIEDVEVQQTWESSGMSGTATNTVIAKDVFVPTYLTVDAIRNFNGDFPDRKYADNPYFNRPGVQFFIFVSSPPLLGIARGAMDVFLEQLPGRGITYMNYPSAAEAPLTHHQLAKATFDLEIAEMYMQRIVDLVTDTLGREVTLLERVQTRAWLGQVTRYAKSCVTQLFEASGASTIQHANPLQRYFRDINSLALHALIQPTSSDELYGRVLAGQEPNTNFF